MPAVKIKPAAAVDPSRAPDDVLIASARKIHEPHGPLRAVKVHGSHISGTNAKGQTVITSVEKATDHALKVGPEGLELEPVDLDATDPAEPVEPDA